MASLTCPQTPPRRSRSPQRCQIQRPTSPQGKAISARNAITHGLRAEQTVLATAESDPHYTKLKRDLFLTYQPIDRAEIEIVTNLFNAFWLLRRTERHESDLYDMVVFTHLRDWTSRNPTLDSSLTMTYAFRQPRTFDVPSLSQISRNQSRFTRIIDRSLAQLRHHREIMRSQPECPFDYQTHRQHQGRTETARQAQPQANARGAPTPAATATPTTPTIRPDHAFHSKTCPTTHPRTSAFAQARRHYPGVIAGATAGPSSYALHPNANSHNLRHFRTKLGFGKRTHLPSAAHRRTLPPLRLPTRPPATVPSGIPPRHHVLLGPSIFPSSLPSRDTLLPPSSSAYAAPTD